MCFSSPISFAAAAVLTTAGAASLKMVKKPQELILVSFPFIFAIQQFSEGFIWLYLNGTISGELPYVFGYTFNLCAQAIWPLFAPLGAFLIEPNKFRKKILLPILIGGIFCSIYLFVKITFGTIITSANAQHIIYNIRDVSFIPYIKYFYLFVVSAAFLLSSYKMMFLFGVLVLASFIVTACVASAAYISVWCFFAAILSLIICGHLWNQNIRQKSA